MRRHKPAAPGMRSHAWLVGVALIVLVLWLSGSALFEPVANHLPEDALLAWRHTLARTHGVLAAWSVLGLGWLAARHIAPALRMRPLRWSGIMLLACWVCLALSGQWLQYGNDDAARNFALVMHGWLGLAVLLPVGWHLLRRFRR